MLVSPCSSVQDLAMYVIQSHYSLATNASVFWLQALTALGCSVLFCSVLFCFFLFFFLDNKGPFPRAKITSLPRLGHHLTCSRRLISVLAGRGLFRVLFIHRFFLSGPACHVETRQEITPVETTLRTFTV